MLMFSGSFAFYAKGGTEMGKIKAIWELFDEISHSNLEQG